MRDPQTLATILRAFFPTWGSFFRAIVATALSLFILATWWETLHVLKRDFSKDLLEVVLLLAVLFIAEGLEIAYTVLRDKDSEQLAEFDSSIFRDMKSHENLIYEAREWLVILIVVTLTLKTEFTNVYVPFWGMIPDFNGPGVVMQAHLLFSILFTTVPLVWIAQGPAKEYARAYPQKMLNLADKTRVWLLIKAVGFLADRSGLMVPQRAVGLSLIRAGASSPDPSLKSNDRNWFWESAERFGIAVYENTVDIHIDQDGLCRVRQRLLVYAVSPQTVFRHSLMLDSSAIPSSLKTNFVRGYNGPPFNGPISRLEGQLDALVKGESLGSDFEEVSEFCTVTLSEPADGKRAEFQAKTWYEVPEAGRSFAMLLECEGIWKPEALRRVNDIGSYYSASCDYPCRRQRLRVYSKAGVRMNFTNVKAEATMMGSPHPGETERLRRAKEPGVTELSSLLTYLIPGVSYKYSWNTIVDLPKNHE